MRYPRGRTPFLVALCLLAAAVACTAPPAPTPFPSPTPVLAPTAPRPPTATDRAPEWPPEASDGMETARRLAGAVVPARDLVAITSRLLRGGANLAPTAPPDLRPYTVGRQDRFWISDPALDRQREITATLRWISPHLYLYVENGREVPIDALRKAARFFEERIYPGHHRYFGSEWNPGVDGDPHLVILHAVFDGAAGYFSSLDEVPQEVNPNSNQHEMFYMNLDEFDVGDPTYLSTLAHEFQHMIAAQQDPNLDAWADEGLAQMGEELSGLGGSDLAFFYLLNTDVQLTAWSEEDQLEHYGASFLWFRYLVDRLGGPEVLRQFYDPGTDTLTTADRILQQAGYRPVVEASRPFDAFFADWVVANYLNNPSVGDGRYAYAPDREMGTVFQPEPIWNLPWSARTTVFPYGADYYTLEAPGTRSLKVAFDGVRSLPLVPTTPHSGARFWWSNRGDVSNTHLTRAFDLSATDRATLRYWVWYDIETDYDYAYVEISTDGGRSWRILPAPGTTTSNPNGNNLGHGYTGLSGDGPEWIEEKVDLSPFAGQKVLVRFELVTDDAINRPGLALDDIELPEIGFFDDAETDDAGWQAAGFVRVDNYVPVHFVVQL
ncbi:MAG: hypothetical protein ACP5SI_07325, partial [Chloroflexia bacterium]